jgi:secreted PhoX family phosphatase
MIRFFDCLHFSLLLFIWIISSCRSDTKKARNTDLFSPIAPDFQTQVPLIPKGFDYQILFSSGDTVYTRDGRISPAKGKHDFVAYIPINGSSEHGWLYVGHESHDTNSILGDGGAGTIFEIRKQNEQWNVVGKKFAIDFFSVGGTLRNCGGTLAPSGTILSAEECEPLNNVDLYVKHSFRDTSFFNSRQRYFNFGWMVEVDPYSRKALRKLWKMGRFEHEDAHCMPDGKTVFLTDDATPSVLFKFIAKEKYQYDEGQLYAYRQTPDGQSGHWIRLPMEIDSLMQARDVAIRRGATLFVRHEWIEAVGDKLYITETGNDSINFERAIQMGGTPALHLQSLKTGDFTYSDPYGRLLVLDLKTNKTAPFLHGGIIGNDTLHCFSNPDALTSVSLNGKTYLVISEDINGAEGFNRNGNAKDGKTYNEVYFLDLSIARPTLSDLKRFMVGPRGCETTGNMFTPNGKSYFVSIQSPANDNRPPFNKSCVIAINF